MEIPLTHNSEINDAWNVTIRTLDIRQFRTFFDSNEKFVEFCVPLNKVAEGDYVKIYYEHIIEVVGNVTKIEKHDDAIIIETTGKDIYGNGIYSGNFKVIINKEEIFIASLTKLNNVDVWETIRVIHPTYYE